jgi:DNA adenine methylase
MPPSIIRYPGSKAKLVPDILQTFPDAFHAAKEAERCSQHPYQGLRFENCYERFEYREPFFGSGAIGLDVIANIRKETSVWINDADPGMFAVWSAVVWERERLEQLVAAFNPTVDAFYRLKESDGELTGDMALDAVNKIALHRMSVSGFGAMAGGPIGGRSQQSGYTVGCRWSPASIITAIRRAHRILSRFRHSLRITNLHFRELIRDAGESVLIYLDPPYYVKGGQLYAHNMSPDEHAEMATLLRETSADWRLSYDDCQEIRDLYSWAEFKELEIRYTNAVTDKKRPKNRELLISPTPGEVDGDYAGIGWIGKDGQP